MGTATILRTKAKNFLFFLICECILCYSLTTVVSSFSTFPTTTRLPSQLRSTNDIDDQVCLDACIQNNTLEEIVADNLINVEPELSCNVLGFYPFPKSNSRGPLEWLLKDTHQAIVVTESMPGRAAKTKRVRMDFMTKDGGNHPVWYDEATKWNVFFGGSIDGEVRVRDLWTNVKHRTTNQTNGQFQYSDVHSLDSLEQNSTSSKLDRLIVYANDYDCKMNLYSNNCRMFAARMEREVKRLNAEDNKDSSILAADVRCALRILWAAVLPTLYPLGAIGLLAKGCLIQ